MEACSIDNKTCTPCQGGVSALTEAEAKKFRDKNTPKWNIIESAKKIQRKFEFKNFVEALDFVNKVGEKAEVEGHHPDLEFGWGYATITIQTHKINGLHENDFILAAKIDKI